MDSSSPAGEAKTSLVAAEFVVLDPPDRRPTILELIRSARQRLLLSLFRCTDNKVLDELAGAVKRGVRVQALVTARAKGGKQRLKALGSLLENIGVEVRPFTDPVVKYHAKYLVVDDVWAAVASLNFTKKCFRKSCDFLHLTQDPEVVSGLTVLFESDCRGLPFSLPATFSDRIIIGPERARLQLSELLRQARLSIFVIDSKVNDADILGILEQRRAEGIDVQVLSGRRLGGLTSHGKLILVDRSEAVVGSMSLSALSLEFRRELAIRISEPHCVAQLCAFFEGKNSTATDRTDQTEYRSV